MPATESPLPRRKTPTMRTTRLSLLLALLPAIAASGCGTKTDAGASEGSASASASAEGGNEESSSGNGGNSGNSTDPTDATTTGAMDTGDSTGEMTMGGITMGFIQDPDGAGQNNECDIWAQDCPDGEKCMPWASDGGGSWNATRCSPVDPAAASPGDTCTVEGTGVSGIDNCELGSMCWDVDGETNMGTCVPFCMGTEAAPVCSDPATTCTIANEGVIILCLPNCDPLLQDCDEGQACYPVGDAFVCGPDASLEAGVYADPCAFINDCDPGLFCANPALVPDCAGSSGCCSTFCDTTDPGASAACPGASGGQECIAWFDAGQAMPGLENLGFCGIPM